MTCLFELSIALLITLLNGFFVMAEYSLVRIRKSRLDELIRQGKSRANTVLKMSEKLDTYLSATQLGITASSLLLGWFGGPLLAVVFRNGALQKLAEHAACLADNCLPGRADAL